MDDMHLLDELESAFGHRARPGAVVRQGAPDTDVYTDAKFFHGLDWREVRAADFDTHTSAIFGFTPEAFCYYFPGVLAACVRENRPDMLSVDALLAMIDRSNMPNSWDDYFIERWGRLTARELNVTQKWLLWLSECGMPMTYENLLDRAFDTVERLSIRTLARPLAE